MRLDAGSLLLGVLVAAMGCAARTPGNAAPDTVLLTRTLRIPGESLRGELGFRFGPPRDTDGDHIADLAAGARYTELGATGMGTVTVWSTNDARKLDHRDGQIPDALFGHCVLLHPDIDGDSRADVVAAAPNGKYLDVPRGAVFAWSPQSKKLLWTRLGGELEAIGWQLTLVGDHNGDGQVDIAAGAPSGSRGKVILLSGRDGSPLRDFSSRLEHDQFGWYVAGTADFDGDNLDDLLVGAPSAPGAAIEAAGAVHLLSSRDGRELKTWRGAVQDGQFGEVFAPLPDLDGDQRNDVAIGAPFRPSTDPRGAHAGEVFVFSGATDRLLWHWTGCEPGELYGRMVAAAGDADGDGIDDLAIGAPWHRDASGEKIGRFELRSGRTGELLAARAGDKTDLWLGWHITAGDDLGPERQRGLVVSSLWSTEKNLEAVGALHVFVYQRSEARRLHSTASLLPTSLLPRLTSAPGKIRLLRW